MSESRQARRDAFTAPAPPDAVPVYDRDDRESLIRSAVGGAVSILERANGALLPLVVVERQTNPRLRPVLVDVLCALVALGEVEAETIRGDSGALTTAYRRAPVAARTMRVRAVLALLDLDAAPGDEVLS